MFRTAELGQKISKTEFDAIAPNLRIEMLEIQQQLMQADFPVIVMFAGVDGAGKAASINLLNEWMDPRWIVTRAYKEPSDEERERPEYWRFWRDLPPKGQFGLFLSAWYSRPILDRVFERTSDLEFERELERIALFEETLADDGALILKFWMHLGKEAQKKRLKTIEKNKLELPHVLKTHWENWRRYDRFIAVAEKTIMRTSTGEAPWTIVEGVDNRYRSLTVLTRIRDALRDHMAVRKAQKAHHQAMHKKDMAHQKAADAEHLPPTKTVLSELVMPVPMDAKVYNKRLAAERARLHKRWIEAREKGISTCLVFEGADAAGKGGAIRRMVSAVDARDYRVVPVAKPTDEEYAQHYLWRFWRHMPRAGRLLVFDRSWYGRVLVERVEGFATEEEWRRAYAEINDFEAQLAEHGYVVIKFWVHITKDEQLARFKSREETPYKNWKLTDEDWRNREKWDFYEQAVNDMVQHTSTHVAPWVLVEGNDKKFSRVKIIDTLCHHLETALDRHREREKNKK